MPQIASLDPATYRRHVIHGDGRIWAETNCYSDVIVELLHGLGHEPMAALPFTLTIDYDVDHWTFFKFPHADLAALYGLGVYELAPWRGLAETVEGQVAAGRPVLVELDSYFLPDTEGTAYRRAHVKSTVAVMEIDVAARRLGYFHNQGYHRLAGEDFAEIFQVDGLVHPRMLPPYIEFVKPLPGAAPLRGPALVEGSLALLRAHLHTLPERNPFVAFKERFQADSAWLLGAGIEVFHAYSFVSLRQYGACYELAATYLRWLGAQGVEVPAGATEALDTISVSTKAFQFQLARAMARGRALDLAPLDEQAARWEDAMGRLRARFG